MEMSNKELFYGVLKKDACTDFTQGVQEDVSELEKKREAEAIEKFKGLMESQEILRIMFSGKKNDGSLFGYRDGVRVELPVDRMNGSLSDIVRKGRKFSNLLLDRELIVRVSSIVYNQSGAPVVIVSADREEDVQKASRDRKKERAELVKRELARLVDERSFEKVPAKVISVNRQKKKIILDICGYGIVGACRVDDWAMGYVNDVVLAAIKPGQVVAVSIIGKPAKENGMFICSRVGNDPYNGLSQKYPKGSIVNARLVSKSEQGYGWFNIDNFDDVQVMCYFPWLRNGKWEDYKGDMKEMVVGRRYRIMISDVNEEKAKFRGRVVGEINIKEESGVTDGER